jgi:hypothetical protein
MITQRINRHTWLRGRQGSVLLRPRDQKRCCLGQCLGDAGVPDSILENRSTPGSIERRIVPDAWRWLLNEDCPSNSEACLRLMEANDARMTEEGRETRLIELFARNGVQVEFYTPVIYVPRGLLAPSVIKILEAQDLKVEEFE